MASTIEKARVIASLLEDGPMIQRELRELLSDIPPYAGRTVAGITTDLGVTLKKCSAIFERKKCGASFEVRLRPGWKDKIDTMIPYSAGYLSRKEKKPPERVEEAQASRRFATAKSIIGRRAVTDYADSNQAAAVITAFALMDIAESLRVMANR